MLPAFEYALNFCCVALLYANNSMQLFTRAILTNKISAAAGRADFIYDLSCCYKDSKRV